MKSLTLLVVDDIEMNRKMIRNVFCDSYFVLEAENGREAMKIIESTSVEIVITDIFMEPMNGYELIGNIRAIEAYKAIPILAITESDKASRKKALKAGADDLMYKPFVTTLLQNRVKGLLFDGFDLNRYKMAYENNPIPFILYHVIDRPDAPGYKMLYLNVAARKAFSQPMLEQVLNTEENPNRHEFLLTALRTGEPQNNITLEQEVGKWLEWTVYQDGNGLVAAMVHDITEEVGRLTEATRRKAEEAKEKKIREIEQKANCDELTGLYNRMALEQEVNDFLAKGEKDCAFIMLDVDNFKLINDEYGHLRGDEMLQQTAEVLRNCFRSEELICRMGGDEFAVFLPFKVSMQAIEGHLSQICSRMRLKVGEVRISCSVGACIGPIFGTTFQELYHHADIALLTAKRFGKDQYQMYDGESDLPSPALFRNMDWLLDETTDAILVCDAENYKLLYLNSVLCGIVGKEKRQCIGQRCYETIWGRSTPCPHCMELSLDDGKFHECEVVPKGSDRVLTLKGKMIEWGGKPARIQYVQDNTEKAHTMQKLMSVSNDRRKILEFLPGGLFRYEIDGEGAFDYINQNLLTMLGYTQKSFQAKFHNSFAEMVWREDRARVLKEIETQNAHKQDSICEYRIERADGSLCWVHNVGHLVTDPHGRRWFYGTVIEIV